jgi:hypothetical protein
MPAGVARGGGRLKGESKTMPAAPVWEARLLDPTDARPCPGCEAPSPRGPRRPPHRDASTREHRAILARTHNFPGVVRARVTIEPRPRRACLPIVPGTHPRPTGRENRSLRTGARTVGQERPQRRMVGVRDHAGVQGGPLRPAAGQDRRFRATSQTCPARPTRPACGIKAPPPWAPPRGAAAPVRSVRPEHERPRPG